jgi:hypothetical protein
VFRVDDADVVVIAVAHAKRRPRFWHGKTGDSAELPHS